jgi:hypothetical protein
VDSDETREEKREREAAASNANKIRVSDKVRKRLRNALESRHLKQSSIGNDELFG